MMREGSRDDAAASKQIIEIPTDTCAAFGDAAAECLELHIKPQPHLAALIAYYPTTIPSPKTKYPPHLHVLCHLAGSQGFAPAFPSYTVSLPYLTLSLSTPWSKDG